ncbi:MAG TPA: RluA family pseudouridine synthase, partial [Mariprofundaceae bacterium]|nr:RluA family pseudouridine synthase [Mariprofundaceae bacterium]
LGDSIYGRKFNPGKQIPEPARSAMQSLARQALHAETLGFKHPITGEDLLCIAPLPDDLKRLDASLAEAYQ